MTRRALVPLLVLVLAPAAQAQNGVTVDPGSPSGKEYAIPLDSARRDAAPQDGGSADDDDASAPLFGAGVGDPGGDGSGAPPGVASSSKGQPRSRKTGTKPADQPPDPAGSAVATARRAAVSVPKGGSGSTLTIAAVAVSVLLLGGVIGSIARRRDT